MSVFFGKNELIVIVTSAAGDQTIQSESFGPEKIENPVGLCHFKRQPAHPIDNIMHP